MNTKRNIIAAFAVLTIAFSVVIVEAQIITNLTSGLRRPAKIIQTEQGNLLVAEEGLGARDGRISIINPQTGARRTLLDGLPSTVGRAGLAQGPSGLVMRGRTLYFTLGEGNPTVACAAPCYQIPNPAGASSPIFSSVLALHFSAEAEMITAGFTLAPGDDLALKNGAELNFDNGDEDKAMLRLVADFHDTAPAPRRGAPQNVNASNPFGIEIIANHVFVADGGMNNVWKVDINTGAVESLITFPEIVLSSGQLLEAVPSSVRVYEGQLLVVLHRGGDANPLAVGLSEIRTVDPQTGADAPLFAGLTGAIDVQLVRVGGRNPDYFLALQFGVFGPPNGPGFMPARLLRFDAPGVWAVNNFVLGNLATSMTRDAANGNLYLTRMFANTIVRVQLP